MKVRDLISFITTQIIMICLLTFNPVVTQFGVAEAKGTVYSETAQASLSGMRDLHGLLRGAGAGDIFEKAPDETGLTRAEAAADRGQKFIASLSKADRGILQTPEGSKFLNEHSRLSRVIALKRKLKACGNDKNSKRKLDQQIVTSLKTSEYDGGCDAQTTRLGRDGLILNGNLNSFVGNLSKTMRWRNSNNDTSLTYFQNDLHMQSLKNGIASYMSLRYKYEDDFIHPETGKMESKHFTQTLNNMCKDEDGNYTCSGKQIKELASFIKKKSVEVAATQKKSNYSTAVGNLNESYTELNKHVEKIHVDVDKGYIYDSADKQNPATVKAMQNYQSHYIQELQKQDGLLMMTSVMKEKAGGYKSLETDIQNTGGVINEKYSVTKHKFDFSTNDLKKAKKEIEDKVIAQGRLLNQMAKDKETQERKWKENKYSRDSTFYTDRNDILKQRKKDLANLVKTNPAAVGQVLLRNPEYANHVCDAIKSIDSQDESDAKWDKVFMVGGLIVAGVMIVGGVVLSATGLGAPLGAATIAGGMTVAGAATATVLVVGGIEAAYWGKRTYDNHIEHQKLETAIYAGGMNSDQIGQVNDAYLAFKEARFNFLLALPAVILPGVGKLASLSKGSKFTASVSKMSAATKVRFLKNMTKFYDFLADYPKMQKVIDGLVKTGRLSADKMHRFFELLATPVGKAKDLKASMNTKFLGWLMKNLDNIDPNDTKAMNAFMLKFKGIVEEGLTAAQRACKT